MDVILQPAQPHCGFLVDIHQTSRQTFFPLFLSDSDEVIDYIILQTNKVSYMSRISGTFIFCLLKKLIHVLLICRSL